MKKVDVFYQGERAAQVEHCEIGADEPIATLKAALAAKHGASGDELLFLEDGDEPLDETVRISSLAGPRGIKVHLHRCRHVEVTVHFGEKSAARKFAPSATIARVKRWAAEEEFHMTKDEASEHVLQITGTHDRPRPGTHLGTLTSCPRCSASFDLVPDVRVNGASAE